MEKQSLIAERENNINLSTSTQQIIVYRKSEQGSQRA